MIEIALMIEGQNGLNWSRWKALAKAAENFGFVGLYRSDHFTNPSAPDIDSLDLWTSLTWLASHSARIEFGPLVSPFSFRHPSMVARMAAAVDDLSGGRLQLGLGAGWQVREHDIYGLDLLDIPGRVQRFREGVEVVKLLLKNDQPVSYQGDFYQLDDALLLPRPNRVGGPPLVLGGNGMKSTLPLAATYADEWNGFGLSPERFAERQALLDELLQKAGRETGDLRRSLMLGCVFGKTEKEAKEKAKLRGAENAAQSRQRGLIAGTGEQMLEQLAAYAELGCQRVMLQWLDLDDIEGLEAMAESILPNLNGGK